MCEALGVQKSRSAPYHPQGNAVVERFNRTLENMLSMTVKEDQSDWDLQIPFVMAAYRATPHSSTGYSPNFMMFGRESAMPTEVAYGLPQGTTTVDQHSYVEDLLASLRKAHRIAFERMGRAAERQKRYYDAHTAPVLYEVGDQVWKFHPLKKPGISPKLQSFWTGPWEVVRRISKFVLEIKGVSCTRIYWRKSAVSNYHIYSIIMNIDIIGLSRYRGSTAVLDYPYEHKFVETFIIILRESRRVCIKYIVKWTLVVIICERAELRRLLAYISNLAYRLVWVMDCYRKISGPGCNIAYLCLLKYICFWDGAVVLVRPSGGSKWTAGAMHGQGA